MLIARAWFFITIFVIIVNFHGFYLTFTRTIELDGRIIKSLVLHDHKGRNQQVLLISSIDCCLFALGPLLYIIYQIHSITISNVRTAAQTCYGGVGCIDVVTIQCLGCLRVANWNTVIVIHRFFFTLLQHHLDLCLRCTCIIIP